MHTIPVNHTPAAPAGHTFFLLDHDINGWTVALIAAVIAAFIYEITMALTKAVTRRIPFLVLQIARLSVPKSARAGLYGKWKADLWDVLKGDGFSVAKFIRGMWFATQLALYGARSTVAVVSPDAPGRSVSDYLWVCAPGLAPFGMGGLIAWVFSMSGLALVLILLISGAITLYFVTGIFAIYHSGTVSHEEK